MKITVHIRQLGHAVDVTLTKKRLLQIKYHNHPGLSTAALGEVYLTCVNQQLPTPCVCADIADSLNRWLPSQVEILLKRHVQRAPNGKDYPLLERTRRTQIVEAWGEKHL